jgi:hypothetical protein
MESSGRGLSTSTIPDCLRDAGKNHVEPQSYQFCNLSLLINVQTLFFTNKYEFAGHGSRAV